MAIRVVLAVCITVFLAALPASAEVTWRDCFRNGEGIRRMLFFHRTDLAHVVDPTHIVFCEYGKVKEGTMASVILELPSPGGRLERESLTPVLSGIAEDCSYRVTGRTLLPSFSAQRLPYVPYVHEIVPKDSGAKMFMLLTGTMVVHRGSTHRLVVVFRGSQLTDGEIRELLLKIIARLSI